MNDILTVDEAAQMVDCVPETMINAIKRGEIPAVKIGRSWKIPRGAFLTALDSMALEDMTDRALVARGQPVHNRRRPLPTV